jgi:hypothetical protein
MNLAGNTCNDDAAVHIMQSNYVNCDATCVPHSCRMKQAGRYSAPGKHLLTSHGLAEDMAVSGTPVVCVLACEARA